MALKNNPVPMPEKRVTYKKATNGTTYVYYTLRAYRNKHGAPTSDEVSIGKRDELTGQLIPNRRYYEIFHDEEPTGVATLTPRKTQSCGNTATFMEIAKQTDLLEVIQKCFPAKWGAIMASAFYILCEGNVMMYIRDWFEETKVTFVEPMNDSDCSKLFASITEEERNYFFTEWVKCRGEKECIAYDVTSISTYSDNIDIAEWGYNRDNDNLPQINLGMYYGITSHMPVYYNAYSGSIPDKVYLEFMMTTAKDLGVLDVCFVFDRGFVTEDNFLCLEDNGYSFITALPKNRIDAKKIIDKYKTTIRKSANRISEYEIYGVRHPLTLYGLESYAHIYYDPEKQTLDEKELYSHIDRLQKELEKISQSKRIAKKYKEYFVVDDNAKETFCFELDTDKVDAKLEQTGFFILVSNKSELSSADVLRIYRERDAIEKNFNQFKNRLDFKRMRTHWNETTEGKLFVGFLALILRSYMQRAVKSNYDTKNLTFEKILIELRKIKSVTLSDMSEILIPLTKRQKTILSALDVPLEIFDGVVG
jgi:transposase